MTRATALEMMADVLEGLRRSDMVDPGDPLNEDTVLIGARAVVDSVGFVTFIAEVEDRLNRERAEPIELILTDIWQFNADSPSLSAGVLADYCATIVTGGS